MVVMGKASTWQNSCSIAQFLYEMMCRHGYFAIHINDQGRETVNKVSDDLHLLIGIQQRVLVPITHNPMTWLKGKTE